MKYRNQTLILIVFWTLLFLYHFFGYLGHFGYDDLHYAKLANDFNHGIIDYNNHYSFRTPIIVITSLSYLIFGISDFASSLPSLLLSMGILFLVYKILKDKGNRTLTIGLALSLFSNWFIFYSDKLMPDIYIAFAFFFAIFIIYQYRFVSKRKSDVLFALYLNLVLLFGFMSKGTIVLILPLLFFYFLVDIIKKQHIKFWIFTILFGIIILTVYLGIIGYLTGDIMKRFKAIAANSYLNLCSYDQQSLIILLKRIGYYFFEMLLNQGMLTGYIFVIAYLIWNKSLRFLKMEDSFSFWLVSSLILILSSNFMSISLTSYIPMCLDPRHHLFLIPVVAISASFIVNNFIENKTLKTPLLIILFILSVISFFSSNNIFWQLYFPLFILCITYIFLKQKQIISNSFTILFIIVLIINPFMMVIYANKIDYNKQKAIISENILNTNDSLIVISDDVQKRLGEYYNLFKKESTITFRNFKEYSYDSTDNRKKILILNWYTRYLSNMVEQELPFYARNISTKNLLLFQDKKLNFSIYEMNDFSIPNKTSKLLLYSKNDFENNTKYWNQTSESISNTVKYTGNYSNQLNEFSSTFVYEIDSLNIEDFYQLNINCNVYCFFEDKTTSKLVISVENNEGAYIWDGIEINKYLSAYSNWWQVKHEIIIKRTDIKAHSRIKIYLWNIDNQNAYIDDFQVNIIGNNFQ